MSSFPKLKLAFVNIFWNSELHRFKIQNGFPGFTAFQAIEFCYSVYIKCSEAFWWGLGGRDAVFLGIMAFSFFLTSGVKTVVICYFWKTQQAQKTIHRLQLKRKKNQTNPRALENIWVWCDGEALCSLCPERFFTLHHGPIKYITYLFLGLFPKEKKKGISYRDCVMKKDHVGV